jgi:hypothetical protein
MIHGRYFINLINNFMMMETETVSETYYFYFDSHGNQYSYIQHFRFFTTEKINIVTW